MEMKPVQLGLKRYFWWQSTEAWFKITLILEGWAKAGRMGWTDTYGVWDGPVHTAIFKMDNQQRPAV